MDLLLWITIGIVLTLIAHFRVIGKIKDVFGITERQDIKRNHKQSLKTFPAPGQLWRIGDGKYKDRTFRTKEPPFNYYAAILGRQFKTKDDWLKYIKSRKAFHVKDL